MTYQTSKSLRLAHPLHQHHHLLFLGRKSRKLLPNKAFDSLEKLHVIPRVTETCYFFPSQLIFTYSIRAHENNAVHKHAFRKEKKKFKNWIMKAKMLIKLQYASFLTVWQTWWISQTALLWLFGQLYGCSPTREGGYRVHSKSHDCNDHRFTSKRLYSTLEWVGMS